MYSLLRSILFTLPPEIAHELSLTSLKSTVRGPVASFLTGRVASKPVSLMGLTFPNPVGLAAGMDKNADYLDALAGLGFGFIEVGTVTPRPQPGNPKPRLFRIPEEQAIINRMGFNNKGIGHLIQRVESSHYRGILGINIGKNRDTPVENAVNDYLYCLEKAYPYAGYITVNISSPNTPGLRNLQSGDELEKLLSRLLERREQLAGGGRYVPLVLKIAPDLDERSLDEMAATLLTHRIDGVIVGNTTLSRVGVAQYSTAKEAGGLSGKPLMKLSTEVLRKLHIRLNNAIPIIGVGGICRGEDALQKFSAGAKLVQIYTGFIYQGPTLIREIAALAPTNTTARHE